MGKLFRPILFIFAFIIMIVTEVIREKLGYGSLLPDSFPLWYLYIAIVIMFCIIIGTLYIRRKTVREHDQLLEDDDWTSKVDLKDNEYYYQSPLYIADGQVVRVLGGSNITYSLHFNNTFQRWLAIIIPIPIYGVHLQSENHNVKIKCNKLLTFGFDYSVYIDDHYFGKFSNHKMTSSKGVLQFLPFYIDDGMNQYNMINGIGDLTANVYKNDTSERILSGKRSFLDIRKAQLTNLRGESHNIEVFNEKHPAELWLAFYALCMILKNKPNG